MSHLPSYIEQKENRMLYKYTIVALLLVCTGGFLIFRLRSQRPSSLHYRDVAFDISSDGKDLLFCAGTDEIRQVYRMDILNHNTTKITDTLSVKRCPSYIDNGTRILFVSAPTLDKPTHLYQCNLDGSHVQQITSDDNFFDDIPTLSPDGKHIAFARASRKRPYAQGGWTWDQWDVYQCDRDGSHCVRLTDGKFPQISGIGWSSDGTAVVFSPERIVSVLIKNGNQTTLDKEGHFVSTEPQGKQVVYTSTGEKAFEFEVYLSQLGARRQQITHNQAYNLHPRMTSDGKYIWFLADYSRDGRPDVCRVNIASKTVEMMFKYTLFREPNKL